MKPLNRQHRVIEKSIKDLDITIVKVNGQDLSNATHEETVDSLNTAQEPIIVEVLRRSSNACITNIQSSSTSAMTQNQSAMNSVATQTDACTPVTAIEPSYCSKMFTVPAPPPLNSSCEEIMVLASSSSETNLSGEDQSYDVEYDQVTLKRTTCTDLIGLTLCYGEAEADGVSDIYVGAIEPNSVAGRNGRIQEGDQIIKINNKEVRNREEAIQLFSENRSLDISLLICRPANLDQMDDGFLDDCGNHFEEDSFDEFMYAQDIKMMPLIVEEKSEFEDESMLTDTATLPSQKEKEGKDSGVGQDSAGSSEQECDSSHYETINPADDIELTTEIVEDSSNFRRLLESRCVGLSTDSVDQLCDKLTQLHHNYDNNNRVVPKMGTKIIHHQTECSSMARRVTAADSADTAYSTADSVPTTLELTKNTSGSTLSLQGRKHSRRSQEKKKQRRSGGTMTESPTRSHPDITYTTEDKLAEIMAHQQKLLLQQSKSSTLTRSNGSTETIADCATGNSTMEWVAKVRSDGTRYITRRPIRTKILKERKKKLENERCGMTTDDDAMSELKTGRHWSREDRRRHLQKSREHQQRKAIMQQRIEQVKKAAREGQNTIIELSYKKLHKHTMKDIDFASVQELLAHQGKIPVSSCNLVSVTTV